MNWRKLMLKLKFWRSSEALDRGSKIAGWSSRGIHPLLIDHVLENVLQLVLSQQSASGAAREIRNIRLVCRFWRDTATPVYTSDKIVTTLRICHDARNRDHMDSFLDIVGTNSMLIPTRYEIHGNLLLRENDNVLGRFMRIRGVHAKSLVFHIQYRYCEWNSDLYEQMQIPNNLNLTNLRRLAFRFVDFDDRFIDSESVTRSILAVDQARRFLLMVSGVLPTLEDSVQFMNRDGERVKLPELYREKIKLQEMNGNYGQIVEVQQIYNLFRELAPILWVDEHGIGVYYTMIAYEYVEVSIHI